MKPSVSGNLIYGKRCGSCSLRVYRESDDTYTVIQKKYFFGICIKKKFLKVNKYSDVEDYIVEFKNLPLLN